MKLLDNTVNLNELETYTVSTEGNKRIRTYYFVNTFQQANNIMLEILNAINVEWKKIDPYGEKNEYNIMKKLQQIQNLIYNIMETTMGNPIEPLIDRVNTELFPMVNPRICKETTMDLIITLYDDENTKIESRIPNVQELITIVQFTETTERTDTTKLNKIKEILRLDD